MSIRMTPDDDRTMAFAGVLQSGKLVYQLAMEDYHDRGALHESIYSLLRMDAESTEAVYGSRDGVRLGLETLSTIFSRETTEQVHDIFQYGFAMHQLSLKLMAYPKTADAVMEGLAEAKSLFMRHYGNQEEDEALCEHVAGLYSRTISMLAPRIMVKGEGERLENPKTAAKVRSVLFAGIRSAFLWHQLGGRRWHIFFTRNDYQAMAKRLAR